MILRSGLSEQQIRSAFRLALLVCILAIAYLSFVPLEEVPLQLTLNDKLKHFLAFAVLAWLAHRSYPGRYLEPYRWAFLVGYGLIIELIQGFLPFRELSLLDVAADAAGIAAYTITERMYRRPRSAEPTEHKC